MLSYENIAVDDFDWPLVPGQRQPEGTVITTGLWMAFIYPAKRNYSDWVAMVFRSSEHVSYGTPNVSELDSHPLTKVVPAGRFCRIKNSPLKEYAMNLNRSHSCFRKDYWDGINHYFAFLWDYTFECLASGYRVLEYTGEYEEAVSFFSKEMKLRSEEDAWKA
ncbi:MAG: hypothetical protein ACSHYA_01135 [Opitutaceae bacterium]